MTRYDKALLLAGVLLVLSLALIAGLVDKLYKPKIIYVEQSCPSIQRESL